MSYFTIECDKRILEVQKLLTRNPEWENRYEKYANEITANSKLILDMKRKFREWKPLFVYMNVSAAKSHLKFSLRYLGQDVAKVKVGSSNITISTEGFGIRNKRDFDCKITLKDCDWRSQDAKKFRSHFSGNNKRTTNSCKANEEHRIESSLLTEFSKKKSDTKELCHIQPVKVAGIARFQMPTPLNASNKNGVSYSSSYGGGIDILSRIGKGKGVKLCIMEVKDENKLSEPPTQAILQGLAYATFIRELLRSQGGPSWWKLFGFNGSIPKSLSLYVASVMPSIGNDDSSFVGEELKIDSDRIHLGALYFAETINKMAIFKNYLPPCK